MKFLAEVLFWFGFLFSVLALPNATASWAESFANSASFDGSESSTKVASSCEQLLGNNLTLREALIKNVREKNICRQEDPELKRRRYALKDGGLCGPTVVATLLASLAAMTQPTSQVAPDEIIRLTDRATRLTRNDARLGLDLSEILRLLELESAKKDYRLKFRAHSLTGALNRWAKFRGLKKPQKNSIPKNTLAFADENTVFILGTDVYSLSEPERDSRGNETPRFKWGHVSIGFDFDPEKMTIKLVDPTYPQKFYRAHLRPIIEPKTGKPTFELYLRKGIAYYDDYPDRALIYLTDVVRVQAVR